MDTFNHNSHKTSKSTHSLEDLDNVMIPFRAVSLAHFIIRSSSDYLLAPSTPL